MTVGIGFFSFSMFVLFQVVVFGQVTPDRLLKALKDILLLTMGLPLFTTGILCMFKILDVPWQLGVSMALMALLIHGLLCFVYLICIFGSYESSVRMRLVRELAHAKPEGMRLDEILQQYNPKIIAASRLRRLVGSGDVVEREGFYTAASAINFFSVFNIISGKLKQWLG